MVSRRKPAKARRAGRGRDGAITREEFLLALREMREEFAGRFEAMDRRFEAMDRRFEAMERRFEAMERRFEAMDGRFQALRDWVSLVVGRLQTRIGRRLEETVAGALRLALSMYDISPDQVKLRQRLPDPQGKIGPPGREYEYDILVRDGEFYIFDVKSTPEVEDVLRFNDKAELAMESLGRAGAHKVLVTLDKDPEILAKAEELGILVV